MSRTAGQSAKRKLKRTSHDAERLGYGALQKLLREFASSLLPRGMTPKLFADLARSAFVQAAAERSLLRNGRVNQSRVAAQTGLSRADVKRLLHLSYSERPLDQSPVQRVLNGWRQDRLFSDRRGNAKRLKILGCRSAFKQLVEKYAGDIPYRAVLDELVEFGAVTVSSQYVVMRRSEIFRNGNDFSFLSPIAAPFEDALRIVSRPARSKSPASIQRLHIPVATEVDLAIVKARCIERATSMLEGLGHSTSERVTIPTTRGSAAYSFSVTILLAENSSNKPRRGRIERNEKG